MSKEHSFKEGQEVLALVWSDGTFFSIGDVTGCDKITVIMECGHMSKVPWFAVWRDGEIICKHNSIYICSVALKNE
jgi:hypothetical protein